MLPLNSMTMNDQPERQTRTNSKKQQKWDSISCWMRGPVCEKSEIDFINKASVPAPATDNAGERNVHRSVPLTGQAMIPQAAVNTAVSAIMMLMLSGGSICFPA